MKLSILAIMLTVSATAASRTYEIPSPGARTVLTLSDSDSCLVYSVAHGGTTMLADSPLGLHTSCADFASGLRLTGVDTTYVSRTYSQSRIKHSTARYEACRAVATAVNAAGDTMAVEFSVGDNDIAFRYLIPRLHKGETGALTIAGENSGFAFPEGTTAFFTPQSDAMIGWKRTKPSYEEVYAVEVPVGTPSGYGHGFTFPALFHVPGGWVLLGETGVDSHYVGSHISDCDPAGVYRIAFPMAGENNGNGDTSAAVALPAATPWRTITLGRELGPIVETTVAWDLVEPLYEPLEEPRPGRGTRSRIMWQDESINYDDQRTYIDFAADMGYENALIDNWWDTRIGRDGVERLVAYARDRGVGIILWYSSSGWWNDIVQGPVNVMSSSIERKKAMRWMRDIGVKGIKVDFFGGDKQETMRLYEDILADANDYGIAVIFHGCTMPRGWERMYPNYVGSEAVLASENMVFSQDFCDNVEAVHATLHPFIRNALGSMEYGGTILNKRMSRSNDSGTERRTSDAFQLATAVLFQNAVQNFALAPNNLHDAPAAAIDFMKRVPTVWDETRFIDGYPGKYAVIARRHGDVWYVGGVSALDEPVRLHLRLPMCSPESRMTLLADADASGRLEYSHVAPAHDGTLDVVLYPRGGFVVEAENASLPQ